MTTSEQVFIATRNRASRKANSKIPLVVSLAVLSCIRPQHIIIAAVRQHKVLGNTGSEETCAKNSQCVVLGKQKQNNGREAELIITRDPFQ